MHKMKISINSVPETERQKDMIDTTTIPIDPIDAYKIYGFETFHPLVSVVDLSEATQMPNHINFRYGVGCAMVRTADIFRGF